MSLSKSEIAAVKKSFENPHYKRMAEKEYQDLVAVGLRQKPPVLFPKGLNSAPPNNPPKVRVKSASYQLHDISLTGIAVVANSGRSLHLPCRAEPKTWAMATLMNDDAA